MPTTKASTSSMLATLLRPRASTFFTCSDHSTWVERAEIWEVKASSQAITLTEVTFFSLFLPSSITKVMAVARPANIFLERFAILLESPMTSSRSPPPVQ